MLTMALVITSVMLFWLCMWYVEANVQVCGSELTDLLSLLCGEDLQHVEKRLAVNTDGIDGSRGVSKRNGIIDECCYRQCDLGTLQMYCSSSASSSNIFRSDINDGVDTTLTPATSTVVSDGNVTPTVDTTSRPPYKEGRSSRWGLVEVRYIFVRRLGTFMSRRNLKHLL